MRLKHRVVKDAAMVTRLGPKGSQVGAKWDKSGDFSAQIQYILAHRESDLKKFSDLSNFGLITPTLVPKLTLLVTIV